MTDKHIKNIQEKYSKKYGYLPDEDIVKFAEKAMIISIHKEEALRHAAKNSEGR